MAKKQNWLDEGRKLLERREAAKENLDKFYADCEEDLELSKRTVQDRLKVIALVDSHGHSFTAGELRDVQPTRLRGIDAIPVKRGEALTVLRSASKRSTMDSSGRSRSTLEVSFQDSVAVVVTGKPGRFDVTLAIERRAGQLLHRAVAMKSEPEVAAFIVGACWSAARLVVSWPGAVERARAAARWAMKVHADLGTWVADQADGLVRRPGAWGPKLLAGYSKVPRRGAVGGKAADEGTAAAWCSSVMGWAQSDDIDVGAADAPVARATVLLATVIALPQDLERVEASATGSELA